MTTDESLISKNLNFVVLVQLQANMGVVEFEYITKNMTPERSMRVCREWDQMVCKLLPDFFTNNERLEGNGELGTVSAVTLGHGNNFILTANAPQQFLTSFTTPPLQVGKNIYSYSVFPISSENINI